MFSKKFTSEILGSFVVQYQVSDVYLVQNHCVENIHCSELTKKTKRSTYTCVDIIKLAFQRRFTCSLEPIKVEVLKMKSVERFGQFDFFCRDWNEGLFSVI